MDKIFDQAIEILEITDITKITVDDLLKIEKKAKIRWHPDKVAHLNDQAETEKYTNNSQRIVEACEIVYSYLNGTYEAGEKIYGKKTTEYQEPEEIIRNNATDIQNTLKDLWDSIKEHQYKWSFKEITLSDGSSLKDLLTQDFKEDIAMLSVVSFFYGLLVNSILVAIAGAINPALGTIVGIFAILQGLSCFLGLLPLSRFWLPEQIQNVMFWFINYGLKIYDWAEASTLVAAWWVQLLVVIPNLFARAIKYIILYPLYEITKAIVGDKVIGVVTENVNYYAGASDWYIEDLLHKKPMEMTSEELFDLSYIHKELSDVKRHF